MVIGQLLLVVTSKELPEPFPRQLPASAVCRDERTIEVTGTSHCVGSSIREAQPVTIAQKRQLHIFVNAISTVTRGAPESAGEHRSIANNGWQLR